MKLYINFLATSEDPEDWFRFGIISNVEKIILPLPQGMIPTAVPRLKPWLR